MAMPQGPIKRDLVDAMLRVAGPDFVKEIKKNQIKACFAFSYYNIYHSIQKCFSSNDIIHLYLISSHKTISFCEK